MEYQEFLKNKIQRHQAIGFDVDKKDLNENLFDWQKDVVQWALKKEYVDVALKNMQHISKIKNQASLFDYMIKEPSAA